MIDFLVIGGGIAGTSAAARLSELGQTLLLERESSLGYHASGRSAALYESNYGLASTVALSKASSDFFHNAHGGFLSPRGLMFIAAHGQKDAFAKACEEFHVDPISIDAAVAKVPILNPETVGQVAFHEAAFDIDTDRMIQTFAKQVRDNAGTVLTGQEVTAIARTKRGWDVTSNDETYSAKIVFNAAGAWVDSIARLAGVEPLGFTPMRRSMARIPAPGGHDLSGWPMILDIHETWYAKPDAGSLLVSPAEEDPMQPFDAWPDDMVLAEGIARYQEYVTEEVTQLTASWAGLRTFSPDRNLVLGPSTEDSTFFWVAGQGGYGFQSAPAASQYVADQIAGRASELDQKTCDALSPERFA
ncbi:glycine/D-amino acid oxidase-like deaminating enzyme [Shimia isoporae]|uniref:Glycine/D-amino acid oxidase-like deaminating enzyme n=1 Tax=Shimia isoporae TaxID=647720 RepID=A0A4R1N3Y0_9RHOB|nr:FAD-binding oxidoreductase [Shimia isoporae]TCL00385.1 glycine/D-amino acid oxidase-like deaminating enzyme [Shimia isoporae]